VLTATTKKIRGRGTDGIFNHQDDEEKTRSVGTTGKATKT